MKSFPFSAAPKEMKYAILKSAFERNIAYPENIATDEDLEYCLQCSIDEENYELSTVLRNLINQTK